MPARLPLLQQYLFQFKHLVQEEVHANPHVTSATISHHLSHLRQEGVRRAGPLAPAATVLLPVSASCARLFQFATAATVV